MADHPRQPEIDNRAHAVRLPPVFLFCVFAWFALVAVGAQQREESPREKEAVRALKELGADVKRDEQGRVVEVVLSSRSTDEALAQLGRFGNLRRLNATGSQVTDAGLRHLRGMEGLEELWLHSTPVSERGISHLCKLAALKKLSLASTRVTDAALPHLSELTALTHLYLDNTPVTVTGLRESKLLGHLKVLSVGGTEIGPAGRYRLRLEFPNLSVFPLDVDVDPSEVAEDRDKISLASRNAITLLTSDDLLLKVTYYPGSEGKETVPVVLLHDYEENWHYLARLASHLQSLGHAVLVPDLRGHGGSKTRLGYVGPVVDAETMESEEFRKMALVDMPRLKEFLIAQNNAGKLNIEKLVVVGVGMGASIAMHWARDDWSIPPDEGGWRRGQDIKALVLISPDKSTPGLTITSLANARPLVTTVQDPQLKKVLRDADAIDFSKPVTLDFRKELSFMILVGNEDAGKLQGAKHVARMLTPYRPKAKRGGKSSTYGELKTRLQGTRLLQSGEFPIDEYIRSFISRQVARKPFPWAQRKK